MGQGGPSKRMREDASKSGVKVSENGFSWCWYLPNGLAEDAAHTVACTLWVELLHPHTDHSSSEQLSAAPSGANIQPKHGKGKGDAGPALTSCSMPLPGGSEAYIRESRETFIGFLTVHCTILAHLNVSSTTRFNHLYPKLLDSQSNVGLKFVVFFFFKRMTQNFV